MTVCFSPISSITVFFAALKHSSSTSDAYTSIKSSSSSSASVASFDSCCILDLCLRRNLEKRPRICMLDSHSVVSNILSPSIMQAVRISFVTCFSSCFLSRPILNFCIKPDVFRKLYTSTSLEKSPSCGKPWSTCHWPLQPVQSNFYTLMTLTESDEPTPSSLCHKDFQSLSRAQDLHDDLASSYGAQGRPGSLNLHCK